MARFYEINLSKLDGVPDYYVAGGVKYFPERTCKMEFISGGPLYDVWRFSCCGFEYSESRTDDYATELPGNYCPNCGAKVTGD